MNKDFQLTELTIKGKPAYIYDNCVPLDLFERMRNDIFGREFTWHYNSYPVTPADHLPEHYKIPTPIDGYENNDRAWELNHIFYSVYERPYAWSSATQIISPILEILSPRAWIRARANLDPRESDLMVNGWHYDMGYGPASTIYSNPYDDTMTASLYMNTNNGYTLLETGDKIESVENRLLLHPNDILHTGVNQTDTNIRVLLSFSFFHNHFG